MRCLKSLFASAASGVCWTSTELMGVMAGKSSPLMELLPHGFLSCGAALIAQGALVFESILFSCANTRSWGSAVNWSTQVILSLLAQPPRCEKVEQKQFSSFFPLDLIF